MGGDGEKDVEKVEQLLGLQSKRNTSRRKAGIRYNIVKHSGIESEWDTRADTLRNSVMIFSDLL